MAQSLDAFGRRLVEGLILGGTSFVGRHIAEAALAAGLAADVEYERLARREAGRGNAAPSRHRT